ncbi:MAG TPA: M23/M56 family metallopeptidase [bacterium]|nr:M23/M56 family metallopeptidase [bacterium]HPN44663.1 M23/M56 family metallopeptidase [bacterium]
MNILALLHTIGDPILHFLKMESLYVSILFMIVFCLSLLIGRKSPYLQIGLWSLLLVRLALPPALSTGISLGKALQVISLLNPFPESSAGTHGDYLIPLVNVVTNGTVNNQINSLPLSQVIIPVLLAVWICGVLIFAGIFYTRIRKYQVIIASSITVSNGLYTQLVGKWRSIFKVKRPVRLVTSAHEISPFTIGLLRPVIYLPAGLLTTSKIELLEPVIAHEMAHIKYYDSMWIRLQNIISSLYFFHPAVWVANLKINQAREFICDGQVLMTQKITRKEYGKGLLYILKMNLPGTDCPAFIPGFASPIHNMKHRITQIKGEKLMKKSHIILSGIIILLAGLLLLPMSGKTEKTATAQASVSATDEFAQLADNAVKAMQPTTKVVFTRPLVSYTITAQYGAEFMFNGNKIKHKGIDLKAPRGTNILAAADGIVTTAEEKYTEGKGLGKYIVIQHDDGFKTLYAHLDKILIQTNTLVEAGQVIGQLGDTGQGTGPHLHFEMIHQDENLDPASYINF